MQCQQQENKKFCRCTYHNCERQGFCCRCVKYHRGRNELPGCFFPEEIENLYDRSLEKFIEAWSKK